MLGQRIHNNAPCEHHMPADICPEDVFSVASIERQARLWPSLSYRQVIIRKDEEKHSKREQRDCPTDARCCRKQRIMGKAGSLAGENDHHCQREAAEKLSHTPLTRKEPDKASYRQIDYGSKSRETKAGQSQRGETMLTWKKAHRVIYKKK